MPFKVAVYVGNFIMPPKERFVEVFRKMLGDNIDGCDPYFTAGDDKEAAASNSMKDCVRYTMDCTSRLMCEKPLSTLAASIVPFQLDFQVRSKKYAQLGLFVSVQNNCRNEWLYTHFVGERIVPLEVVAMLADTVNQVMEERGGANSKPPEEEFQRATSFISILKGGIDFVFAETTEGTLLNS